MIGVLVLLHALVYILLSTFFCSLTAWVANKRVIIYLSQCGDFKIRCVGILESGQQFE